MERIMQTFKEYDMEVLLAKRNLITDELQKNKDLHTSLVRLLERIEKAIVELKHANYDSDWTPDMGLEPMTTRLKVWRSTDWANRVRMFTIGIEPMTLGW